jgi:hypothetical protein
MIELEYDLDVFDRPLAPDTYFSHSGTPRTPQQALKLGEKLIELLKAEGIADQTLQKA